MGFSQRQLRALRRNVSEQHVRTRSANGRALSYIEGWHLIAEANRIFGFEGWDRETVESRCVLARETRGTFSAVYLAKVRVTVRADGQTVVREGHGTGEGRGSSAGDIHDIALKGAETDATKRALATFGKPFGLSLYANGKPEPVIRHSADAMPQAQQNGLDHVEKFEQRYMAQGLIEERLNPQRSRTVHLSQRRPPNPKAGGGLPLVTMSELQPQTTPVDDRPIEPQSSDTPDRDTYGHVVPHCSIPAQSNSEQVGGGRIDKSLLALGQDHRRRDKIHLRFVAAQPCLVCGRSPSDPHHLQFVQPRAMGSKVSDEFTVPLCRIHHRELHRFGDEMTWWRKIGIKPVEIAQKFWSNSVGEKQH